MKRLITPCVLAVGASLTLSACNPYDPAQRAVGGGLIGAGTGAAIGGVAAGGHGAAIGAVGAVTGAVTTPAPPPRHAYGYRYAPPPPPPYGY